MAAAAATKLILVRHGEPAAEFARTHYGQADVPLGPAGVAMSERVAIRLAAAGCDAVYASDLQRATALAERLAERVGVPLRTDAAFRERGLGSIQGTSYAQLDAEDPAESQRMRDEGVHYRAPGGGENFEDLAARVRPAAQQLLTAHAGQHIVLVSHASPMRVLVGDVLGMPMTHVVRLRIGYCGICELDYRPGRAPRLLRMTEAERP